MSLCLTKLSKAADAELPIIGVTIEDCCIHLALLSGSLSHVWGYELKKQTQLSPFQRWQSHQNSGTVFKSLPYPNCILASSPFYPKIWSRTRKQCVSVLTLQVFLPCKVDEPLPSLWETSPICSFPVLETFGSTNFFLQMTAVSSCWCLTMFLLSLVKISKAV